MSVSSCVDPNALFTETVYLPLSSKSKDLIDSFELHVYELSMTNFWSSASIILLSFVHSIDNGFGQDVISASRVIVLPYVTKGEGIERMTIGFAGTKKL